jgi:dTMP kinase
MKKGLFIVIEGIDGSGKGAQSKLLYNWLKKSGFDITLTREPTYTVLGEVIREALKYETIKPEALALLFAADRAVHLEEIEKKTMDGKIVISDRYYYSSIAYQGAQGVDKKWLNEINKFSFDPDLIIYLDVSPDVGLERISSKKGLRSTTKEREFLEKKSNLEIVRKNYLELANENSHFFIIDAERSKNEVQTSIRRVVGRFLPREDIVKNIIDNPVLIEEGLIIERRENKTNLKSVFDIVGIDRNNKSVILEIKRGTPGMSTVEQLDKNISNFKQENPGSEFRVFLIAPNISSKIKNQLIKKGIEYREIKFNSNIIEDSQIKLKEWD